MCVVERESVVEACLRMGDEGLDGVGYFVERERGDREETKKGR